MARRGRRGRDRIVVGFTTTYAIIAIIAYHNVFLLKFLLVIYPEKTTTCRKSLTNFIT
jgi:hypothetical protein